MLSHELLRAVRVMCLYRLKDAAVLIDGLCAASGNAQRYTARAADLIVEAFQHGAEGAVVRSFVDGVVELGIEASDILGVGLFCIK